MPKDKPDAAKLRVTRRRQKLAASGLKEVSSVIVPIEREVELREIAKKWTDEHMAQAGSAKPSD